MSTIETAATEYRNLKNRISHPDGSFDKGGRWYPSAAETCTCCAGLRSPSRAYPYSLMVHCRTAVHVASKYGVEAKDVKKLAKTLV